MLSLDDGSRVAVIGGGPAGSFFSYFLLSIAGRVGIEPQVDIYESRDFSRPGPHGCNMCGGIVSESLVQALAIEGINLPATVVKKGIDSYVLHMDVGSTCIQTPLAEKRIAAIHRGGGPLGIRESTWHSFDGYLLELALDKGANLIHDRVNHLGWSGDRPQVTTRDGSPRTYDLLVGAVGVNSPTLKLFQGLGFGYQPPQTTTTYIGEFYLGQEAVERYIGSAMHVFLLNLPRLEFAAIVPKGEYVTLCLLGEGIDQPLVRSFLEAPEVRECLPFGPESLEACCHCSPRIGIQEAAYPFADRVVLIGDCGVTRLYKDGIGAAYRTAKAAAVTAIFEGISADDFRRHYWPVCWTIRRDNQFGKVLFFITRQIQRMRFARRGVLNIVRGEQTQESKHRKMSMVLWDTFTGSAPYRDVFLRSLKLNFLLSLLQRMIVKGRPLRSQ